MLKRIEVSYIYIDNKNLISPNSGRKLSPIHTKLTEETTSKEWWRINFQPGWTIWVQKHTRIASLFFTRFPWRFWVLRALPWPCCRIGAPPKKIPPKNSGGTNQPELQLQLLPFSYNFWCQYIYIYIAKRYLLCSYQWIITTMQLFEDCSMFLLLPQYHFPMQQNVNPAFFRKFPAFLNQSFHILGQERVESPHHQGYFEAGFISNSRGQNRQMSETKNSGKHSNAHQKTGQVRTKISWNDWKPLVPEWEVLPA